MNNIRSNDPVELDTNGNHECVHPRGSKQMVKTNIQAFKSSS